MILSGLLTDSSGKSFCRVNAQDHLIIEISYWKQLEIWTSEILLVLAQYSFVPTISHSSLSPRSEELHSRVMLRISRWILRDLSQSPRTGS